MLLPIHVGISNIVAKWNVMPSDKSKGLFKALLGLSRVFYALTLGRYYRWWARDKYMSLLGGGEHRLL
jgi:hypothetical protein